MSSPTWRVTRSTSSCANSEGVKCSPAVGAAAEPVSAEYTVWYRSGLLQTLVDVRRQRRLSARLALEPNAPPPVLPSRSSRSTTPPCDTVLPGNRRSPAPRRRDGLAQRFPVPVVVEPLEQQELDRPAGLAPEREPGGQHAGVVDDDEVSRELGRQIGERPASDTAGGSFVDEQPRRITPLRADAARSAVAAGRSPARRTSSDAHATLAVMDEQALERAQERIAGARAGRFDEERFEAALKRSRKQVEALATTAAKLEAQLPDRIREAIEDGLRNEVRTIGAQPRGDPRSAEPGPAPARATRAGTGRRAAGTGRRPRDPRRPGLLGLARCGRAPEAAGERSRHRPARLGARRARRRQLDRGCRVASQPKSTSSAAHSAAQAATVTRIGRSVTSTRSGSSPAPLRWSSSR